MARLEGLAGIRGTSQQRALEQSERRMRAIMDSTREAIYGVDLLGACVFANTSCLRLTGYDSVEDLLGRDMHALIHHTAVDGRPLPVTDCKIYRAFRSGVGVTVTDEVFWRQDGRRFPIEYSSPVIFTSGHAADATGAHEALQEGVNFLAKPYGRATLARVVRERIDAGGRAPR